MSLVLALFGALRAAFRTHTSLALENLALRQQLALLRNHSRRPRLSFLDRAFWVWLSQRWTPVPRRRPPANGRGKQRARRLIRDRLRAGSLAEVHGQLSFRRSS
jgi:hypothetical protein